MMIRRKVIWLVILMVWVGMVTSIIIYQGNDYLALEDVTSENVQMEGNRGTTITGNETLIPGDGSVTTGNHDPVNVNFTQTKGEESQEDFFVEYRLERDKARSEQVNIYRELVNNPNTDEGTKKEAQRKMLELTEKMEKEMEIESLIRARGYRDALAYIHDEAVDVIIQTNGLERDDVHKIGDIIIKVTGFNTEDVTIIEKKVNSAS